MVIPLFWVCCFYKWTLRTVWGLRPFHPGLCHFFFWRRKALLGFFAGEGSNLPATCPARIGDWEVALAFGDGVGATLDYEPPERLCWFSSGSVVGPKPESAFYAVTQLPVFSSLGNKQREREQCLKPQSPLKNGALGRFGSAPVHKIQEELRGVIRCWLALEGFLQSRLTDLCWLAQGDLKEVARRRMTIPSWDWGFDNS